MNQLNWYIARRYFFAKRSNRFISWVGGVSMLGIALGVTALIITMSVLNGFESEVTNRITNFIPHLTISPEIEVETLRSHIPESSSIYFSTDRKAMLKFKSEQVVLNVRAIDQDQWTHLLKAQSAHSTLPGRLSIYDQELPGIVVGVAVADNLFLNVGDTLVVESPLDAGQGQFRIPSRHFVVTGVFQSEIFDFDRSLAIIPYVEGRRLFKSASKQVIHVHLNDFNDARLIKNRLIANFPELEIKSWYDQHKTLFDAMRMEKWGSFIGLNLIILVAVFNIVSSLMMMVLEKTGSIGILRVMGAHTSSIQQIFNMQGFIVAFLGVVLGTIFGTGLVLSQAYWSWIRLPEDIYLIPVLPVKLIWSEIVIVAVAAFTLVVFSIRYPAKKAARLKPLEAINYKR